MSKIREHLDKSDCFCSYGMQLKWDINDPKLPQNTERFDPFVEWTDGYVRYIYSAEDKKAQRHLSGWAMRNTNNHNSHILKKSCLGVVVCAQGCGLQPRPAICDKARQKQQKKLCPSCNSALQLIPCRGHSGFPVTNFWRLNGKAIFFQAKGVHDHPRPESKLESEVRRRVVKTRMFFPSSPHRRKIVESELLTGVLSGTLPLPAKYHNPWINGADRFGLSNLPIQHQPCPSFPSVEPHKVPCDLAPGVGDAVAQLRKTATHRPPCGYDLPTYPYLSPSGSLQLDTDLTWGNGVVVGAQHDANSSGEQEHSYGPPSTKMFKAGYGEQASVAQAPANSGHSYYTGGNIYRYSTPSGAAASHHTLQATTTTTKVYQPCKPSLLKYGDGLYDVKHLAGCGALLGGGLPAPYSDSRMQEDCGTVGMGAAYSPDTFLPKAERPDCVNTLRYATCTYPV